jgi:hypothetical protein
VQPQSLTLRSDERIASAKLTVLAAAPVVPAERGICAIVSILTGNAQANSGHGFSARLGNTGPAFRAVAQGRTLGQTALRAADPILYGRVDLILYCTVTCPTRRHDFSCIAPAGVMQLRP